MSLFVVCNISFLIGLVRIILLWGSLLGWAFVVPLRNISRVHPIHHGFGRRIVGGFDMRFHWIWFSISSLGIVLILVD